MIHKINTAIPIDQQITTCLGKGMVTTSQPNFKTIKSSVNVNVIPTQFWVPISLHNLVEDIKLN